MTAPDRGDWHCEDHARCGHAALTTSPPPGFHRVGHHSGVRRHSRDPGDRRDGGTGCPARVTDGHCPSVPLQTDYAMPRDARCGQPELPHDLHCATACLQPSPTLIRLGMPTHATAPPGRRRRFSGGGRRSGLQRALTPIPVDHSAADPRHFRLPDPAGRLQTRPVGYHVLPPNDHQEDRLAPRSPAYEDAPTNGRPLHRRAPTGRAVRQTSTPRNDGDLQHRTLPDVRGPRDPAGGTPRLLQWCAPAQPWQRGPLIRYRHTCAGGSLLCCGSYPSMEPRSPGQLFSHTRRHRRCAANLSIYPR